MSSVAEDFDWNVDEKSPFNLFLDKSTQLDVEAYNNDKNLPIDSFHVHLQNPYSLRAD